MPRVHLPGGGIANFPDDTPPAEIEAALAQHTQTAAPRAPRSYLDDVLATGGAELSGAFKGATAPILHPIDTVKGLASAAMHPLDTGEAVLRNISRLATEGSPEDIGDAIGQVLGSVVTAKAAPMALRGVGRVAPGAIAATGEALTRGGSFVEKVSPFGLAEAAWHADPRGLAVAAAPYAMKAAGRGMSAIAEKLGAGAPAIEDAAEAVPGLDRYMPNVSSRTAAPPPAQALAGALADQGEGFAPSTREYLHALTRPDSAKWQNAEYLKNHEIALRILGDRVRTPAEMAAKQAEATAAEGFVNQTPRVVHASAPSQAMPSASEVDRLLQALRGQLASTPAAASTRGAAALDPSSFPEAWRPFLTASSHTR